MDTLTRIAANSGQSCVLDGSDFESDISAARRRSHQTIDFIGSFAVGARGGI
jgi:hypothetical protein